MTFFEFLESLLNAFLVVGGLALALLLCGAFVVALIAYVFDLDLK